MSASFKSNYNIWYHCIVSTANRLPFIISENEKRILQMVAECFNNQKLKVEVVNGDKEHLHLLLRAPADIAVSDAIENALTESLNMINDELFPARSFNWHNEYAIFSVSQSQAVRVRDYIQKQKEIHIQKTFLKEWKEFLEVHGILS